MVGVALATAGCTVQVVAPPATAASSATFSAAPIGFRCLPRGTIQAFSTGGAVTWIGTDPANSDICIGRNGAGAPIQAVRGFWNIGRYWPDTIPSMRSGLAELTTKPAGTVATFTVTGPTATAEDPRPGTWTHSLRVVGREPLVIAAGRFDAHVIDDDERTTQGSGHWTRRYWIDAATGAFLKSETLTSSNGLKQGRETVSLRLPR